MADYRTMFDREYIGAWDLNGKDVTVTVAKVEAGNLMAQGGRKSKKPIVHFEGREKGFVLNKTNAKCIAALYGTETSRWVGKRVTIYPTTTSFGNDTVECIRVRPTAPSGKPAPVPVMKSCVEHGEFEGETCPACVQFGDSEVA